ncbi:MAG: CinA family protein [Magnetococcales bacterium]|nr:CinA family protein [Magnetococcales bacterium]
MPPTASDELKFRLEETLADRLYAKEPISLEEQLGKQLATTGLTAVTAESCTGGLVAARITGISGSSDYFTTSFVSYSNQAKSNFYTGLEPLIKQRGAVSAEVAMAMARGALRIGQADLAVAVTGIAGPSGGSDEKPVGTVFLAAVNGIGDALDCRHQYLGGRDQVRIQASQTALHMLRRISISMLPK